MSPELSFRGIPWIDGSMLLLILLMSSVGLKKVLVKYGVFLLLLFSAIYVVQYLVGLENSVEGNLRMENGRVNATWGVLSPEYINFDIKFLFRNLVKILLAGLVASWLLAQNLQELLIKFIVVTVFYASLYYLLIYLELWNWVVENCFYQKYILFDGGDAIHLRNGVPRLELGFSEPSYFITMLIALCLPFLPSCSLSFRLLIMFIILYLLTQSVSVFALVSIIILNMEIFQRHLRSFLIALIFGMLLFQGDFIRELILSYSLNPSIVFRLLGIFDFSAIAVKNYLFGIRVWDIYVQPPFANVIVQLGILGTVIFILTLRKLAKDFDWILLIVFLFVSPQLYNMSFYILFFLIVGVRLRGSDLIHKTFDNSRYG